MADPTKRRSLAWRTARGLLAALALATLAALALGCAFSAPGYQGDALKHFDGTRFSNLEPTPEHGFSDFLKWTFERDRGPFEPDPSLEPVTRDRPLERVGRGEVRVTVVGHSTVLLQVDGLNLLTDPMWSERASPVSWAGPKRGSAPGLRLEDLPPLDAILISHNHYDHLDLPTLRQVKQLQPGVPILTGLGNTALLEREGLAGSRDLDWWQEVTLPGGARVTFVPAQHFSGRGLSDRNRTLWGGFVVQSGAGVVYFAGDTGRGPHFAALRERFGPPRLALIPIGAYRPRWFMAPVHLDPAEAVEAHRVLGAGTSVGIHYGTFALADDGRAEPLTDLAAALTAQGVPAERFVTPAFGEAFDVPALSSLVTERRE